MIQRSKKIENWAVIIIEKSMKKKNKRLEERDIQERQR